MTDTRPQRTQEAKEDLKWHIKGMMMSGEHDIGAIVAAMREILEEWSE